VTEAGPAPRLIDLGVQPDPVAAPGDVATQRHVVGGHQPHRPAASLRHVAQSEQPAVTTSAVRALERLAEHSGCSRLSRTTSGDPKRRTASTVFCHSLSLEDLARLGAGLQRPSRRHRTADRDRRRRHHRLAGLRAPRADGQGQRARARECSGSTRSRSWCSRTPATGIRSRWRRSSTAACRSSSRPTPASARAPGRLGRRPLRLHAPGACDRPRRRALAIARDRRSAGHTNARSRTLVISWTAAAQLLSARENGPLQPQCY
jgi:hypothetical protein